MDILLVFIIVDLCSCIGIEFAFSLLMLKNYGSLYLKCHIAFLF